jgi:hypothetical protein
LSRNNEYHGEVYQCDSLQWWDRWRSAEVLYVEPWKEGVKRLHVRDLSFQPPQFFMVYCADEFLPRAQIERYV